MIAALFVTTGGVYYGLDDVEPWDRERDARRYAGPWPVVAHPPCERWGITPPKIGAGWTIPDAWGGASAYVEQSRYGHAARKPTWLYAVGVPRIALDTTRGEQRIPQWMIDRYGYEKARRIGVISMIGGKDKKRLREATPTAFRDMLISLASSIPSQAGV